ncbi:MAG TPA: helix-turn-helix domain-containing protein, partial [Sphingomicrobium sp.]
MLWSRISPPLAGDILQTGRLKIDVAERRASLDGQSLSLSPLLFNLLLTLVRRQGRLVTRQELKLALWTYATRIDTERRLNTAMRALRAALKDDAEAPRLIETVRGRGYRWIETGRPPGRTPRIVAAGLALVALVSAVSIGRPEPVNGEVGGAASILEAQSAIERWRSAPTAARLKQAAALVEQAGQDNDNPAFHILKGNLALEGRWDWARAEAEFRRALSIEPSNADARLALAWLLANRGAKREALAHVHGLIGMAALNEDRRANLGWLLIRLDQPDLALAAC